GSSRKIRRTRSDGPSRTGWGRWAALGRETPPDSAEQFNMAYVAMRGSAAVNAVRRLHGDVSRQIFQPIFPSWATAEVPIGHVTNGIHTPSWESTTADELWAKRRGEARWRLGLYRAEAHCVA